MDKIICLVYYRVGREPVIEVLYCLSNERIEELGREVVNDMAKK